MMEIVLRMSLMKKMMMRMKGIILKLMFLEVKTL